MAKKPSVKKYPVYVYLKDAKKYGTKVVCNGIVVTTYSKTKITSSSMMNKLSSIYDYIIIEEI